MPVREVLGGAGEPAKRIKGMEFTSRTARCQDGRAIFGGLGLAWSDTTPGALGVAAEIFGELLGLAWERSPAEGRLLAADGSPAEAIDLAVELNRPLAEVREAMGILEARGLIESQPCPPTPETARGASR